MKEVNNLRANMFPPTPEEAGQYHLDRAIRSGAKTTFYILYIKSKIVRILKMQFFNTNLYKYGNGRIKRKQNISLKYIICFAIY